MITGLCFYVSSTTVRFPECVYLSASLPLFFLQPLSHPASWKTLPVAQVLVTVGSKSLVWYNTVKSFSFVGTLFRGVTRTDIVVDT